VAAKLELKRCPGQQLTCSALGKKNENAEDIILSTTYKATIADDR